MKYILTARNHHASNLGQLSLESREVYMGTSCLGWQSNERWRQKPQKGAKWRGQMVFGHPS